MASEIGKSQQNLAQWVGGAQVYQSLDNKTSCELNENLRPATKSEIVPSEEAQSMVNSFIGKLNPHTRGAGSSKVRLGAHWKIEPTHAG